MARQSPVRVSSELSRFRAISDRYLEEFFRLFPQDASELGLHAHDGSLGENGASVHLEYERLCAQTAREVEALADSAFTGDDWLDRRGLLALLRTHLHSSRRGTWRIDPQLHSGAAVNSIFNLIVRNSERLAGALVNIHSRLEALPRFLAQGASCIRKPVPLWTKLAIQSCQGAETFLIEAGRELAAISPDPAKTERLFKEAAAAFHKYARTIAAKEPGPADGYSIGREGFEFLIRERTGLPYSCAETRAVGERLVEQLHAQLGEEVRKFGRKKAAQVLEEAAAKWQPGAATLIEEYQRVNARVKGDFKRAGLVTFPEGERCKVMLVPPFLRHNFPTAAYSQPGAFDSDQTGIFWVNDLSLFQKKADKKAAEIRQHFGLEFTCAHEAYPGHHLQFCIQNRHPSKLRRLFHHAIFYEGWTLWCEKMSVDQGVITLPEARLIQLHDALWRAHRIVIDTGLHDGALSFKAACRRLETGVGFTPARARGDVNWYTASPTVPMSYLLGRLEVERLHARLVQRDGWDLRRFNDWILSFGAIPWRWIWEAELRGE
ncbi:MAG TPA: DUF885 domain-containing protein [Chthoniobacteraceae bacterium]|nr:DUF885 domain-containing protein [Chthoniobacteraceae bacterium]